MKVYTNKDLHKKPPELENGMKVVFTLQEHAFREFPFGTKNPLTGTLRYYPTGCGGIRADLNHLGYEASVISFTLVGAKRKIGVFR